MASAITKQPNLSDQIAAILREEIIADPTPGRRLPPIVKLAKRFGVSYETVRSGLRLLVQEGLVQQRDGAGTYVADPTKNRHVGVLIEQDISDPHSPYFFRLVSQRLVRFFRKRSVPARLYAGHAPVGVDSPHPLTCIEFVEAANRGQLCGLVVLAAPHHPFSTWGEAFESLRKFHVPVVAERGKIGEEVDALVYLDYASMVRLGTQYLLDRGRRRIALLEYRLLSDRSEDCGRDVILDNFSAALAAGGASVNPRWVRRDLHPCVTGAGWEEFRDVWLGGGSESCHGDGKPDGLLICDDNLFSGAAMAICQLGLRVPDDLRVVTHFVKGSTMTIPFHVAKLEFDPDVYVRAMGKTLIKLMQQQEPGIRQITLPCDLVETEGAGELGTAAERSLTVPDELAEREAQYTAAAFAGGELGERDLPHGQERVTARVAVSASVLSPSAGGPVMR